MHFIAFFLFLLFLGFSFVCFIAMLWGAWFLYRFLQKRKQQRAHRLAVYLRRLRPIVAELLRQANELDQVSKYSGLDRDANWSKKYGEALNKLLDANTKLEETNVALVEQELPAAQDCLLYVIRTIHIVSYRLKEMEPVEEIIEMKSKTTIEYHDHTHDTSTKNDHVQEARAANASAGQTSSSSTPHVSSDGNNTHHIDIKRNADEHSILKASSKKKEV